MVLRSTVSSHLASPLHLAHTHSHKLVSLDTTPLRSNLHLFAIYSIVVLSTTFPFMPTPDCYSITPEQTLFAWNQANSRLLNVLETLATTYHETYEGREHLISSLEVPLGCPVSARNPPRLVVRTTVDFLVAPSTTHVHLTCSFLCFSAQTR